MNRTAASAADFLPFAKLTRVSIAPRVRSLLEGAYLQLWPSIEPALKRALDDLDGDIFKQADRAPNSNEQHRHLEAMREFRRRRGDFEHAFRESFQREVISLVDPSLRPHDTAASNKTGAVKAGQLSLVDPGELEEELALSEISARAEMRNSSILHGFAYRLAVIADAPPLEPEAIPIGPHRLCAVLRIAAQRFEVGVKYRVMLFKQVERLLFGDLGKAYEGLQAWLIAHRVLPNLTLSQSRGRVVEPGAEAAANTSEASPTADSPAAESAAASPRAAPREPAAAPRPAPVAARPEAQSPAAEAPISAAPPEAGADEDWTLRPAAPRPDPHATPALHAFHSAYSASAPAAPQSSPSSPFSSESIDAQFFSTLRELLSGRRIAAGAAEPANDTSRPVAHGSDLQAVLTVLQAQPASPVLVGGKWITRRVSHIKQDILNQLRAFASDGQPPRLSPEDTDTVDLVGMLFDHLLGEYRPNSVSHSLMSRLQVPLLKVALKDKSFFTRRNHPARQLLNAIAETSAFWVEDEEQDRPVIEKMQVVVDRVINEFDDDLHVFEDLFGDLSKHIGSLQKKAEVAERRHVEAARGREKLELSRAAAMEAIQQRLFERELPEFVKTLLENAWVDALALSMLRQGIESPTTVARVEFIDRLVDVFAPGRDKPSARGELNELRAPLEEGLAAVGFHEDAIRTTWADLSRLVVSPTDEAPSPERDKLVEQIKSRPRLGEDPKSGESAAATTTSILKKLQRVEKLPVGPQEQAMIERIKHLPFGTWFEFTVNQQGEKALRKLCWFSPVTGRCVFVNAKGAKAEERMIDQLARDLIRGNARIYEERRESLLDKTWKSIMGFLRGQPAPGGDNAVADLQGAIKA